MRPGAKYFVVIRDEHGEKEIVQKMVDTGKFEKDL